VEYTNLAKKNTLEIGEMMLIRKISFQKHIQNFNHLRLWNKDIIKTEIIKTRKINQGAITRDKHLCTTFRRINNHFVCESPRANFMDNALLMMLRLPHSQHK
jgi:hypothetical protein